MEPLLIGETSRHRGKTDRPGHGTRAKSSGVPACLLARLGTQSRETFHSREDDSRPGSATDANVERPCGEARPIGCAAEKANQSIRPSDDGILADNGHIWGRPVVTVAPDGSLLVTDDWSKSIWRISYTGK
jgi:hypothetical protein